MQKSQVVYHVFSRGQEKYRVVINIGSRGEGEPVARIDEPVETGCWLWRSRQETDQVELRYSHKYLIGKTSGR